MDDIAWTDEPEAAKTLVQNLLDVTRILSPTGMEKEISDHCAFELMKNGFVVQTDKYGNIMAHRGWNVDQDKYILLNAHMDVVGINKPEYEVSPKQHFLDMRENLIKRKFLTRCRYVQNGLARLKEEDSDKLIFPNKEIKFAYEKKMDTINEEMGDLHAYVRQNRDNPDVTERIITNPWQPECIFYDTRAKTVRCEDARVSKTYVGGDDKAGVAIILTLAQITNHPFKVLLTVAEETTIDVDRDDIPGAKMRSFGIELIPGSFYNDVGLSITLDKRYGDLLVHKIGGKRIAPPEVIEYIEKIGEERGLKFKRDDGLRCDALMIHHFAPAVNMSVGYYDPHEVGDYINVIQTHNIMTVVKTIIEDYNEKQPLFMTAKAHEEIIKMAKDSGKKPRKPKFKRSPTIVQDTHVVIMGLISDGYSEMDAKNIAVGDLVAAGCPQPEAVQIVSHTDFL